ncbi:MAG TPA: class I SAM-dependent methyltransferase [Candidatus Dormibacteraeota bacterium]|jgi:SAM-dependent methyltransferase|nr:class I SAM-dependent methyltransferase [Candidatus Dormibacteraeota bacterium]
MAPPRAQDFVLDQLAAFDDEALATFLAPGDGGVGPGRLGTALQGDGFDDLAARVVAALPAEARATFQDARDTPADAALVAIRRRQVVDQLFWALLYWHDPDGYEELVAGEQIHPGVLDALDIDGRAVADLGAGAGRFTLFAARRARRVIAVDAVPALLDRLVDKARALELENIEVRRGSFTHLPLDDASVDIAVACSSLTSHAPWGGECALREVERIVRPGGDMVVIWPDDPDWFCARGFTYMSLPGAPEMHFRDVESAARICAAFYSERAARWVRDHDARVVPFEVLGVRPPSDACFKKRA